MNYDLKVYVQFIIPSFLIFLMIGCNQRINVIEDVEITIRTSEEINLEKITYETSNAVIEIALSDFLNQLEARLQSATSTSEKEEIQSRIARIKLHFEEQNILALCLYNHSEDEINQCDKESAPLYDSYEIAKLIESGNAVIFNKQSQNVEAEITMHRYAYTCGALCGQGSRSFYFADEARSKTNLAFFEVLDWIS